MHSGGSAVTGQWQRKVPGMPHMKRCLFIHLDAMEARKIVLPWNRKHRGKDFLSAWRPQQRVVRRAPLRAPPGCTRFLRNSSVASLTMCFV